MNQYPCLAIFQPDHTSSLQHLANKLVWVTKDKNATDVVRIVCEGEWYRVPEDSVTHPVWHTYDAQAAIDDGWIIESIPRGSTPHSDWRDFECIVVPITTLPSPNARNDPFTLRRIRAMARKGSELHLKALVFLRKNEPKLYQQIIELPD